MSGLDMTLDDQIMDRFHRKGDDTRAGLATCLGVTVNEVKKSLISLRSQGLAEQKEDVSFDQIWGPVSEGDTGNKPGRVWSTLAERRKAVAMLRRKNQSIPVIAGFLRVSEATISRDIQHNREQSNA